MDTVPVLEQHHILVGQRTERNAAVCPVKKCKGAAYAHTHGGDAQPCLGVQEHFPGRNNTTLGLEGSINKEGYREQESQKITLHYSVL